MKSTPLVSVVLTSYNQQAKLKRAFESVINQTYKNLDIVIVDDCSTDGISKEYIHHIAQEYPDSVRFFFQPKNVGIPKNKNTGFKLAKGDFVTYLDGDDYYYPEKIETELNVFRLDETVDVVYSNFYFLRENGMIDSLWKEQQDKIHQGSIFKHVVSRNFPKNTLFRFELLRADVLKLIHYYDESIPSFHDWDSRIRYSAFATIGYANIIGSAYVKDIEGISQRTKKIDLLLEMRRVFLKNYSLLEKQMSKREAVLIKEKFLNRNRIQILKSISIIRNPLLYLKVKLKFTNIHRR